MSRRKFLKKSVFTAGSLILGSCVEVNSKNHTVLLGATMPVLKKPIVIATWNHGLAANKAAWEILKNNGPALDAVEKGVRVSESDENNRSVGLGGLPDKNGMVTLDACIMNHENECGAVGCLTDIEHPISVARKVMEDTPHVMLVGQGAYDFAIEKGFPKVDLLTAEAKLEWENWKASEDLKKPAINCENHDTIGMLAMDAEGNISGACTTSGWAYKLHGRIGDSPIIGAGLFVDNEVGGACATGMGEAVIRIAGSATVVELMRHGKSPQEACEIAVKRIMNKHKNMEGLQVGFLAMNNKGEVGAYSVYAGFNYAVTSVDNHELIDAGYEMEW
ncbi:glycosylasparaginase [Putridiphycobacter roseus]|uniref:Glycosylasparaginase n=1 Tax=Putridiphycobacter roseus TaxID=2219161 RepID=A0A2W1N3R0_9FLAO|nr:N(4)-(beta-N-acetylglucosaminyl)-L-asparaginase [Putridiphycobacter roseus]PZE17681.1 glycosylasparaginase [Putridiphycobacter roseus]